MTDTSERVPPKKEVRWCGCDRSPGSTHTWQLIDDTGEPASPWFLCRGQAPADASTTNEEAPLGLQSNETKIG